MSQLLLTSERSFWSTWRRIAYFGLDQTKERLIPIPMGGLSKTDKLQTLAHMRTTQTAVCNGPVREPLTTARSTESMAIIQLSEYHLFTHNRMRPAASRRDPQWKVPKNCPGDVGQQAALVS